MLTGELVQARCLGERFDGPMRVQRGRYLSNRADELVEITLDGTVTQPHVLTPGQGRDATSSSASVGRSASSTSTGTTRTPQVNASAISRCTQSLSGSRWSLDQRGPMTASRISHPRTARKISAAKSSPGGMENEERNTWLEPKTRESSRCSSVAYPPCSRTR